MEAKEKEGGWVLGTLINVAAVLLGGGIGTFIKGNIPRRLEEILMQSMGLCVIFIGISGALTGMLKPAGNGLESQGTILLIASLVLGSLLGEACNIEYHVERLGERLKKLVNAQEDTGFVAGFMSNTLVSCIGAMAVVGALQDGFSGDYSMLAAKAILDGVITMIFAASFGIGPLFAALPLGVYQGGITLLAHFIAPYLTDRTILELSYIGSVLICGVGINLLFGNRIRVGNMLPALLVPILYEVILMFL